MIASVFSSAFMIMFTLIGADEPPKGYEFSIVETEPRRKGAKQYTLLVATAIVLHAPESMEKPRVEKTLRRVLSNVRDDVRRPMAYRRRPPISGHSCFNSPL